MAIEKRVILNSFKYVNDIAEVQLGLLLVDTVTNQMVRDPKWHRTTIPLGVNVRKQMGFVSEHLAIAVDGDPYPPVPEQITAFIEKQAAEQLRRKKQ